METTTPVETTTLVRTNHRVRSAAFAFCCAVVAVYYWQRGGAGLVAWTVLALQFLVYPHVVYWRARLSTRPTRAELDNLFLDAALLGAWCAELGFPTWITYLFVGATTLNAVVNRGAQGVAWSLACTVAGAVLWATVRRVEYLPLTSDLVTALCVSGSLGYSGLVGYVVHTQNRRLAAGRDALRASEERYRLIACTRVLYCRTRPSRSTRRSATSRDLPLAAERSTPTRARSASSGCTRRNASAPGARSPGSRMRLYDGLV